MLALPPIPKFQALEDRPEVEKNDMAGDDLLLDGPNSPPRYMNPNNPDLGVVPEPKAAPKAAAAAPKGRKRRSVSPVPKAKGKAKSAAAPMKSKKKDD